MKRWLISILALGCAGFSISASALPPMRGTASWYGEEHRGRLMANGHPFNPDRLTAASWFYPLGTLVRVTINPGSARQRSVLVTITDRGPAHRFVRKGRILDLAQAAFERLARPELGLVAVRIEPVLRAAGESRRPPAR